MRSTKALVKRLTDDGVMLTDNIHEAMYILADGTMIWGEFDHGTRGQDHRIIECGVEYDRYSDDFWGRLHREFRVVRLVPETNYALIKGRQQLTPIQEKLLANTSYEIERY